MKFIASSNSKRVKSYGKAKFFSAKKKPNFFLWRTVLGMRHRKHARDSNFESRECFLWRMPSPVRHRIFFIFFCRKKLDFAVTFYSFRISGFCKFENSQRLSNSFVEFSPGHFDILYVFFRHRMQKPRPFEDFMTFFCKIHRNSCFSIFPINIPQNITTSQRILKFEVFIIFFSFLQN